MPSTVLLCHPDDYLARRLQVLLHDLGRDCARVRDGESALRLIQPGHPYDLLVLELALPGLDGFGLLDALKRLDAAQRPAIAVVTAFPRLEKDAQRDATRYGILGVLSSKARALDMKAMLEGALRDAPARRSQAAVAAASLAAPSELFVKLQQEKERKRLARIAALHLKRELPQDEALQTLVRETAQAFDFPIALMSLTMEGREIFKMHLGLNGRTTAERGNTKDWEFCAQAMKAEGLQPLLVTEARSHTAFKSNPMVVQGQLGSFAGAPIVTPEGEWLGSLCLVEAKMNRLTQDDLEMLGVLARRVAGEILMLQNYHELRVDLTAQWDKAKEGEARLALLKGVLESLHLGVLLHDAQRKVVLANERLCAMLALNRGRLEGGEIENFFLDLMERCSNPDETAPRLRVMEEGPYEADEIFELNTPTHRFLRWSARPVNTEDGWYQLITFEDLSAEIELEAQRESLATHDPLTELLNRRGAEEEGLREAERSRRRKSRYSLLRLHLDGLEAVNEDRGLAEGDFALQVVSAHLKQCLRLVDRAGRWGGRQFLVILPDTDEAGAKLVAQRVVESVAGLDLGKPLNFVCGIATSDQESDFRGTVELAESRLEQARLAETK